MDIPIEKAWQLNERHYGALQGLNKDEIKERTIHDENQENNYGLKLYDNFQSFYNELLINMGDHNKTLLEPKTPAQKIDDLLQTEENRNKFKLLLEKNDSAAMENFFVEFGIDVKDLIMQETLIYKTELVSSNSNNSW